MELAGKTALITGGARRVGRAIALSLAAGGADIALHYSRSADQAEATAGDIRRLGRRCERIAADLSQPADIERMFQQVAARLGRLDILVNNASVYDRAPLETLSAAQWDAEMAVNARAPALCIRHAAAMMTSGGAIINITDSAAQLGLPNFIAYAASKAALESITKSAALALASRAIRVNAVAPGVVAWPEKQPTDDAAEAYHQRVLEQVPMRREDRPDDIAAAVLFLVRNEYVTGQSLRVDGGWNMD